MSDALCVLPVRRGSKRIPRKNLRPLGGMPLILHAIRAARGVEGLHLVVSTDDPEVVDLCTEVGVAIIDRPPELAGDDVPLDPVVLDAWQQCGGGQQYSALVTVQATSPFVDAADIRSVLDRLRSTSADTVLTVVDDRHIRWAVDEDGRPSLATPRVNRQQLPKTYRETGSVVACTAELADAGVRFGSTVELIELHPLRAVDIDTPADFLIAEALRRQHHVVFNVTGSTLTGSGHVFRAMTLARALPGHEVTFVCELDDELAISLLRREHFPVRVCHVGESREDCVVDLVPTIVVNDVLDTDAVTIDRIRSSLPGVRVVNFEDLGSGAERADVVVNALYPSRAIVDGEFSGPEWAVLRSEFTGGGRAVWRDSVGRVLVTFGGIDECGFTVRLIREVCDLARTRGVRLDVILGLGFRDDADLRALLEEFGEPDHVHVSRDVGNMASRMRQADLAVTSAGRTVLECASQGLPALVIAQNERELRHSFADVDHGIMNLGLGAHLPDGAIGSAFRTLLDVPALRHELFRRLDHVAVPDPSRRLVPLILGEAPVAPSLESRR